MAAKVNGQQKTIASLNCFQSNLQWISLLYKQYKKTQNEVNKVANKRPNAPDLTATTSINANTTPITELTKDSLK